MEYMVSVQVLLEKVSLVVLYLAIDIKTKRNDWIRIIVKSMETETEFIKLSLSIVLFTL